jgi:carbamoyl-phosphate synthase large subunit
VEEMIRQGKISLIINTPIGEEAMIDDSYIRKAALECQVPLITTIGGARALAEGIASLQKEQFHVRSLQSYLSTGTDGAGEPEQSALSPA